MQVFAKFKNILRRGSEPPYIFENLRWLWIYFRFTSFEINPLTGRFFREIHSPRTCVPNMTTALLLNVLTPLNHTIYQIVKHKILFQMEYYKLRHMVMSIFYRIVLNFHSQGVHHFPNCSFQHRHYESKRTCSPSCIRLQNRNLWFLMKIHRRELSPECIVQDSRDVKHNNFYAEIEANFTWANPFEAKTNPIVHVTSLKQSRRYPKRPLPQEDPVVQIYTIAG